MTLCFAKGPGGPGEAAKSFESPAGASVIVITMTRKEGGQAEG